MLVRATQICFCTFNISGKKYELTRVLWKNRIDIYILKEFKWYCTKICGESCYKSLHFERSLSNAVLVPPTLRSAADRYTVNYTHHRTGTANPQNTDEVILINGLWTIMNKCGIKLKI